MNHNFQVIPTQRYDDPRYPRSPDTGLDDELVEETSLSRRLSALLLSVLPLIFLATCYRQPVSQPPNVVQTPVIVQRPPRVVVVTQLAECSSNVVRCRDNGTLEYCPSGSWVARSCDEYCQQTRGHDFYSSGCNATATDPCQCTEDYGMIDGLIEDVRKGEL